MNHSSSLLLSLLVLAFGVGCAANAEEESLESDDVATVTQELNTGFLLNGLSGKCIDISGAPGTGNGAALQLWTCEWSGYNADNGSVTDQRWNVRSDGFIQDQLSRKCIDVAGGPGVDNGAALQLWTCELSGYNADNGSVTDQKWAVRSDGYIQNLLTGKCIDVAGAPGTINGARLQLWDCELSGYNVDNGTTTDQRWW